jgi:hypothetical protein
MNKLFAKLKMILCAGVIMVTAGAVHAQLPSKSKVLADMTLANNYFMQKWPDAGASVTVKGNTRTSNLWTRAVYYEGLMGMCKIDPQKKSGTYRENKAKY